MDKDVNGRSGAVGCAAHEPGGANGTIACCDCGNSCDSSYRRCPRCRGFRCRACDDKIAGLYIDFIAKMHELPPIDIEFCSACYAATRSLPCSYG